MRTLIVVAEGMDPLVLEKEVDQGRLPWFAKHLGVNNYRHLDCGPVPYEPSNLATAFSGVNPGHHGCFSYWSAHSAGEMPRILETTDVMVPRLWEWPQMAQQRFAVVNVQLTHPPKPLNGTLITYPMLNAMNTSYPRSLLRDLNARGVRYAHDVSLFYTGQPLEDFAEQAYRIAGLQLDSALALGAEADVMIVNLTLADRLSHFLWHEVEQDRPGYRPHVLRGYDFIDQACAQLQALSPDSMLVFSEMGFGPLNGFFSINEHLRAAGLQVLDEQGQVDLERSVALETVQGSHGVMLCADLCNSGRSDPALRRDVEQCLREIRFADGRLALADVRSRESVYTGPYTDRAPTFIVRPADARRPPLGDPRWANHVRRTSQSGWHRERGFVLSVDARIQAPEGPLHLQQIAPSIATLSGCQAHEQCELPGFV
ncbi:MULTISPECIES: alkaline phosphatase family protein [Pseudomonas aeruginosa group]|uniref:alkaline phosphatase family protein n=1 Tax=Pseudomonas aeruginosa group TaxID=136841 RepID=UPI001A34F3DB|nr:MULTISPECIES: alkaline phosphatase family protein [Pseudomonas aeruginosa group]MBG6886114.1 alkaline phosphatase family protein [Pseudomonas aeruginosa]MCY0315478.1 alkaline phosphatase family protein [Pseudomonas aeruginosa]MCY0517501.1 alkaline phosphatase family protein [Pseudomonas aeruginosa]MDI3610654.1 alkaline phosphatase family protein [Pseudomonas aeruginosa]MDI3677563.1 alkaline phosphatase family protein [Pseudomonas aeruginosa]